MVRDASLRMGTDLRNADAASGVAESRSMQRLHVFLNVDAGELEDESDELYAAAHALSIACGGHAGDDASMARVLAACARFGTRAGAHPSYVDREGFGRRAHAIAPD